MAIIKGDFLDAEDGTSDAACRAAQIPPGRGVPEDTWDYERGLAKEPPYNLDVLAQFLEVDTCRMRCKTKAVVAAGLRYGLLEKLEELEELEELARFDTDKQVIDERVLPAPTRTGAPDDLAGSVIAVGDVPDIRVRRRRKED